MNKFVLQTILDTFRSLVDQSLTNRWRTCPTSKNRVKKLMNWSLIKKLKYIC